MAIEDDFYATIKLKSGEEIFSKVAASEEEEKTVLIISNPIIVKEVKGKSNTVVGYKVEPWLKTTKDDMFILDLDNVLTMSESKDVEMIMMHQEFVRTNADNNNPYFKLNREMGYISSVDDAKEVLEKLYKKG